MATRLSTAGGHPPLIIIRPGGGWVGFGLKDLWRYRELLVALTWRSILVRYKQTLLGASWAILQPVFFMIVFTIFFGRLAGLDERTGGIPYPIFSFAALLPWTFFSSAIAQASISVVGNVGLVTKVYFPRLTIPISAVLAALVDFALAFLVLVGLMVYYGIYPDPSGVAVLPALVLLAVVTALGTGLFLAALNVTYRDVRYAVPFLMQLWLFATPVVYGATLVPERWRVLLGLNPMAGVVEGFRWALLGSAFPGMMLVVSVAVAAVLLVGGTAYFRATERGFADVV